ncbi:MMPL family transporter [Angustibacter aerolatus]
MATALYRLGRFAFRRRRLVALLWLVVLGVAGAGAATLHGSMTSSFTLPGTESQRALDLLEERMPGSGAAGATARVVYVAPSGSKVTDAAATAAITDSVRRLGGLAHVSVAADPFQAKTVSQDASTAFATVAYDVPATDLTAADHEALTEAAHAARSAGLTVELGGDASQEQGAVGGTEGIGLVVAALVLALTFGSLVMAGLPLLTAVVGVGLGVLGIEIATGFFDLSSTTLTLALMLGLAVAIDYALFIVSRYRGELQQGLEPEEAVGRAVGTAGSAVVFAGATVVVALAALSVVNIPFLTAMGLAAAGTVLGAVVIALTLLPALLGFVGRRALPKSLRHRHVGSVHEPQHLSRRAPARAAVGERWVRGVVRRRVLVIVAIVVGLGTVAVPALDLRLGMPSDGSASPSTTQRRAYDALAKAFGPGFNGPLVIVADLTGADDPASAASAIQRDLSGLRDVVAATPPTLDPAKRTAILTVVPQSSPSDPATERLVATVRDAAPRWQAATGADVAVTGTTAVGIDVSDRLRGALLPYLLLVVGIAFVLLTIVFRSLLVPLKATLGFLLSIVATFGAVVAVFQWGWLKDLVGLDSTGPILSFLPIFLVGILFGLAMDYEVFLVTRMREDFVHGAGPTEAVVSGFAHGARVVAAAAVIMFSVFAGFAITDEPIIKSMGFALAFGVAVDAFLVRMTLVPAVMSLLGRAAWALPRWLDRLVPDVDVEGAKLAQQLAAPAPTAQRDEVTADA